jgi:hypothetical protein
MELVLSFYSHMPYLQFQVPKKKTPSTIFFPRKDCWWFAISISGSILSHKQIEVIVNQHSQMHQFGWMVIGS